MTAVITERLKKDFIQNVWDDLADSAQTFYIGVGYSQSWGDGDTALTPKTSREWERSIRENAMAIKLVADYSFVVPRYDWSAGTIYSAYDDTLQGHPVTPYYVLTDENQVYICIERGTDASGNPQPSTVKPTGSSINPFYNAADGYTWKFLYTIGSLSASKYLSANYMPVKLQGQLDSDGAGGITSIAADVQQKGIQDSATNGQLSGFILDSGGIGYTTSPDVIIRGDGTLGSAIATVVGGAVTKIAFEQDSNNVAKLGQNYNYADVLIGTVVPGGGAGASARIKLGPEGGFGADPRDDLRARAIMLNVKPDGIETGEWPIDVSFRQIFLWKNPLQSDSSGGTGVAFTEAAGNALDRLQITNITTDFSVGYIVTGATSGARAFISKTDSDELWIHQTAATGFGVFDSDETISDSSGGAGKIKNSGLIRIPGKINRYSGEIFYVENRAAVERDADQVEDIKLIIEI